MRTWKVLRWDDAPAEQKTIALLCPHCFQDAVMPCGEFGSQVIAAIGLGLIFDRAGHVPPANALPTEIQCRKCRKIYSEA